MVPILMYVWIAFLEFLTNALRLMLFLTFRNAILCNVLKIALTENRCLMYFSCYLIMRLIWMS